MYLDKLGSPLVSMARALMLAKGNHREAAKIAQHRRALPHIIDILKSPVAPITIAEAEGLAPYKQVSDGFLQSLAPHSALDYIISQDGFLRVPMHTRIAVTTVGAIGYGPAEREVKTPSELTLASAQLKERKCAAFVVASDELLRNTSAAGLSLLAGELRRAVALESDRLFLAGILETTGAYSTASTGTTAAQIAADIGNALDALEYGSNARLFLIVSPEYAKHIAMARGTGDAPAFPAANVLGGSISGVTIVLSDAAEDAILIDASQCAVDPGTVVLDASEQASLQMQNPTTSGTPDNLVSLWQSNMKALRCERVFGCEVLRAAAASVISTTTV
jgi:HK97 family phage major capsid protein